MGSLRSNRKYVLENPYAKPRNQDRRDRLGAGGFEAPCLRFNSRDDARDFVRELQEDSARVLATYNSSRAKDYLNGYVELHIRVRRVGSANDFNLISRVVPLTGANYCGALQEQAVRVQEDALRLSGDRKDSLMLGRVGKVVQGEKKIIPAVVRVEACEEISEVASHAGAVLGDDLLEMGDILCEWKVDCLDVLGSEHQRPVACCMVQGVPEVIENVSRSSTKLYRDAFAELELENVLGVLRVELFHDSARAIPDEFLASLIEVREVFFGGVN